ncbi:MAG: hypothetical protein FWE95_02700 [Planctomycetaceae bacterium]|nr:hypothetical protein [Planctomycetaceae bacterium]
MKFRRFLTVAAAILLCCALFCGNFSHFALAEVVHAYRKPSEEDLQWLFGNVTQSTSVTPDVVQVGFANSPHNVLMSHPGPCNPVNVPVPMPPIPPPPQTANGRMHTGLVPEADGVVNIVPYIVDSVPSIVQMGTGERLPPPLELPREASLDVPLVDFAAEPLPMPDEREHIWDVPDYSTFDFHSGYGTHRPNKPRFYAPDMIGSSAWLTGHNIRANGLTFSLPTMLLSRPNVVEHFNAGAQNRIWADYRHWNNAVSFGGKSRAVEQLSFGLETQLLRSSSVELRVPVISQFASKQMPGTFATATELGNVSVFLKQILCQDSRWTISGGVGATLPTAEDLRLPTSVRLKNNASYLVSFLGAQWQPNCYTFGHFVVQADFPMAKNEWTVGTHRERVNGQQVIRTGLQLGHWIYRVDHGRHPSRLGAFAEINYAVVTSGYASGHVGGAIDTRKSALTAAVGVPLVLDQLTCTSSLIVPISGSDRPFDVGYSFSLSRLF